MPVPPDGPPSARLWRVRGRRAFDDLRVHGRRARHGSLSVTWLPGTTDTPPQVAYSIGRRTGGAVARNRVRRRLRALASASATEFRPGGTYLLSASPTALTLPAPELHRQLLAVLARVHTQ